MGDDTKLGDEVNLDTKALSSWSANPEVATNFAGGGHVVEARVPVEQIFMCPLTHNKLGGTNSGSVSQETEFILMGGKKGIRSRVVRN